jgi:hypothetical protein
MSEASVDIQGGSWFTPGAVRNPSPRFQARTGTYQQSKGLNRLTYAAVVSTRFCKKLLSDPRTALAGGYNGESFGLTPAEMDLVCSIRARSLRSFAAQLVELLQVPVDDSRMPAVATIRSSSPEQTMIRP